MKWLLIMDFDGDDYLDPAEEAEMSRYIDDDEEDEDFDDEDFEEEDDWELDEDKDYDGDDW
jgi:hypothetical protein